MPTYALSENKQGTKLYVAYDSNLVIEITCICIYTYILKLCQVLIFLFSENKVWKERHQNLIAVIFCGILILFFMLHHIFDNQNHYFYKQK